MSAVLPFTPAILSPCGRYRYELRRECSPGSWSTGPLALFCGANPSKADALEDDHTVRKLIGFAQRWGCGGFILINLFAWRSTNPKLLPVDESVFGWPRFVWDDAFLEQRVDRAVAVWGDCLRRHPFATPTIEHFVAAAQRHGRALQCFGRTKIGNPLHPLMLPYATPLQQYREAA